MPIRFPRAALAAALCLWGLAPALAAPLSLEQALTQALEQSQQTRAAGAGRRSAAESARAADQQPDPMLSLGIDNLSATGRGRLNPNAEDMTMKRVGLAQEWVSHDKRAARRAVADAMLARERLMEDVAAAEVRLQTAQAYVEAWYAGEAVTLGEHNEAHAREELEAGKGRLLAAAGGSAEVLMLAGAQGLAADETAELRQQQAAAEAGLQRWLRSRPEALLAPQLPEPPAEAVYVERHPEVLARERELALARQEAEAARLNTKPNWTYELAYGQRQGRPDLVSVGISIPLPIAPAARQDRETAARLALVDKAEAALDEARRAAAGDYARLSGDAARLQQRLERLQAALLTPARQRTEAALAAYRANQAALTAVFEARHAELEAERRRLGLARELARTQVQLIYKPLTEGPTP